MKSKRSSDLIAMLSDANTGRKPGALQQKYQRMTTSPFAFFRGTDGLLASAWDQIKPPDVGPSVLSCGDLHLENYGAYRTIHGSLHYDINDFDEATIVPCSYDLTRCVASILLAAEEWQLGPLAATGLAIGFLDAYRSALAMAEPGAILLESEDAIAKLLGPESLGSHQAVIDARTRRSHGKLKIKRDPVRNPQISETRAAKVTKAIQSLEIDEYAEILDVSGRIAGIGSLGLRRYTVLVRDHGTSGGVILLDMKECVASALTSLSTPTTSMTEAARVVAAQTQLQAAPAIGLTSLEMGKRSFRVCWMVPEENRSSLDRFRHDPKKLRIAIKLAGKLAAWMQMRGAGNAVASLRDWGAGPALDAILTSAARAAEKTRRDFTRYLGSWRDGAFR